MPVRILRTWRFIGEHAVLSISECADRSKVLVQAEPTLDNPGVDQDEEFWVLLDRDEWRQIRKLDPFGLASSGTPGRTGTSVPLSDSASDGGDVLEFAELPAGDAVRLVMRRSGTADIDGNAVSISLDRGEWEVFIGVDVIDPEPYRRTGSPSLRPDEPDDVVH